MLAEIDLAIGAGVAAAARSIPASVRSLDAIPLGSALTLADELEALVAYDRG